MLQFVWDVVPLVLALAPIVIWISGCFWLILRLTRGADQTGGKTAARIFGAASLMVVAFFGAAGLPAYGLVGYLLMLWVSMLLAPFVALAYIAPATVAWLMRHVPIGRDATN